MNDNKTKTICTMVVWIAAAIIFTFGVFSYHWNGDFAGILWAMVAGALVYATLHVTRAIWKHPSSEKPSEAKPDAKPRA